jgi:hypothetical protein
MKFLKTLTEIFFLIFIFLLPWQSKLILRPAVNNFNEVSFYGSYLVLLLALICFFSYQLIKKREDDKSPIIWYFLGGLELFFLISFFFADDKLLAAYHFFILLGGLALFYLLREGFSKLAYEDSCLNRTRAIYVFLTSLFLHSVLGIYQFLTQSSFANKYLGLAEHDAQTLGTSVVETASGRWLRAYGGLDHPNILGGILALTLLLSIFLLARKKIINSNIQTSGLLLLFVNYFVSLAALFFTFSRVAWVAYLIGLIILFVSIMKKEDNWVMGRFLILILFSFFFFVSVLFPYQELVFTRFKAETRLEQISVSERYDQFLSARDLIIKNPIFGIGAGNYVKKIALMNQVEDDYIQPVHNSFILVLAENGLFAFLSLLFFFVFLIRDGRRQIFSLAIISSLLVLMLFEHWFFSLPFGILFFFFILGII